MRAVEIIAVLLEYKREVAELHPGKKMTIASQYSFINVVVEDDVHLEYNVKDWKSEAKGEVKFPAEVLKQLEIADRVAAPIVNCTVGDNYWPGNFSKILLAEDYIELSQVNYMNAKSLAHKKDYSLRSLVFTIALDGKIKVKFSDSSSANNERCGKEIEEALTNEGIDFRRF